MTQQFADLNGLQILVVEQDSDNRRLYILTLKAAGAKVWAATSIEEALAILDHGFPDVMMCGIYFLKGDGYALLRQVRALQADGDPFIPALAVSGYIQGNDQARALTAGFQRYLLKPINLVELTQAVLQVAQERPG